MKSSSTSIYKSGIIEYGDFMVLSIKRVVPVIKYCGKK